jgi:hypothetical protein
MSNFSWRIADEPRAVGAYSTLFHFNLWSKSSSIGYNGYRQIFQSDSFLIHAPAGPERTWTAPVTPQNSAPSVISSDVGDSGKESGLSSVAKIGIGLGVALGFVLLLVVGAGVLIWKRKTKRGVQEGDRNLQTSQVEQTRPEADASAERYEMCGKGRVQELM